MASSRLTEPVIWQPELPGTSDGNGKSREAIRAQLDRILASPVFRNSRRNSALLKHVVERALDGRSEELKERSIGIDVFSRVADYDTNTDHVVRSVAGEVRRRLAQYYMEPEHEAEIQIGLQPGSYVPKFRLPVDRLGLALRSGVADFPQTDHSGNETRVARVLPWRSVAIVAGIVAALGLTWALAARFTGPQNAVERFWGPVFSSPNAVLLCFGGGGQANPTADATLALALTEFEHLPYRRMHTSDAVALANLTGLLQANGKPYRIVNRSASTSFRDLQSGPSVLIGAMNNEWTLRLTSGMRFFFERVPNGARVADRRNPSNTSWVVDFSTPLAQFNRDYAIVSRLRDPKTEQTVVVAAGIGSWGTLAAGEFVTRLEQLKKLDGLAPKHWEQKNLEVVLATDVIRGSSGPPVVLAAEFWE